MMEADQFIERRLRAEARKSRGAGTAHFAPIALVLADFYEEHGQGERAAMWRDESRDAITDRERDRTVVRRAAMVDPRRDAAIWLGVAAGLSMDALGRAFGIRREQIRIIATRVDNEVSYAAMRDRLDGDAVTRRLRTAGAVRVNPVDLFVRYTAIDLPPETWPITRSHESNDDIEAKEAP
jgi:hypothetical protein